MNAGTLYGTTRGSSLELIGQIAEMFGTVAVTDEGWYEYLLAHPELEEVNFWRPSARRAFRAPAFSPFFFKLRAPYSAICGFGYFAVYSALPVWLAWDAFSIGNGSATLDEMQNRLDRIRRRIGYVAEADSAYIGCTMIVFPKFFPRDEWIDQPTDWPVRTQTDKRYDLDTGEGRRVWVECLQRSSARADLESPTVAAGPRYGEPILVRPRLGQGTFRIAVTDAYARACAITGEHSLPVLDAGHIQPFSSGGPHDVSNGLLLRADLHRLFDKGYLTVTPELRVEVSRRLRDEYQNGRSYYPLHGTLIRLPEAPRDRPRPELLRWHNDNRFAA